MTLLFCIQVTSIEGDDNGSGSKEAADALENISGEAGQDEGGESGEDEDGGIELVGCLTNCSF